MSIGGPLALLRDMWVHPGVPEYNTYNTYLTELKRRIIAECQFAREILGQAGESQCAYYK